MKRIEVKLAVPVVAPLLDVIKELADGMGREPAAPIGLDDLDSEFRSSWVDELLEHQRTEVDHLLALFNEDFFKGGVITFDESNAEEMLRACAAVRLRLRERYLGHVSEDRLESGAVDLRTFEKPLRKVFMCFLFLATIQELIIQHLDEGVRG